MPTTEQFRLDLRTAEERGATDGRAAAALYIDVNGLPTDPFDVEPRNPLAGEYPEETPAAILGDLLARYPVSQADATLENADSHNDICTAYEHHYFNAFSDAIVDATRQQSTTTGD